MSRDIKAFAVSGYASALLAGLPVFFAPKQLLIHVPMMAAGLILVVLARAAATKWGVWLGWLLAVIAVVFVPPNVGGALLIAALVWTVGRGRVWPLYFLVLCSLLDVAGAVLGILYPDWLAEFVAAHGRTLPDVSVAANICNAASAILLIAALLLYFRARQARRMVSPQGV